MRGAPCGATCLLVALLRGAEAQCTLPGTLPDANTEFAPDQPAECAANGEMGTGDTCTVECNAGQSQAAAGTYVYVCTGTAFSEEPAPQCAPCAEGEYNDNPGEAACTECPAFSSTATPAAESVSECNCIPGHFGSIVNPDDTCAECPVGEVRVSDAVPVVPLCAAVL
jgi:hypothetical protein